MLRLSIGVNYNMNMIVAYVLKSADMISHASFRVPVSAFFKYLQY